MARTDVNESVDPTQDFDSANVEAEVTEAPEAIATEVEVTEAPEAIATDPSALAAAKAEAEAAAAELEAKITASFENFKTVATGVAAEADNEGHLNKDQLAPVVTAYRDIEGGNKGKKLARDYVVESMKSALSSGPEGFQAAMSWNAIQDAIQTAPAVKAAGAGRNVTPADPTQAFADQVASYRLALELIEANVPEGVDADWESKITGDLDKAQALFDYTPAEEGQPEAPEPEVSAVERAAVKLATGRAIGRRAAKATGVVAGPTYSGPRRDVAVHIQSAFEGLASGTFLTIAEIRGHKSAEYGDDAPSAGAISARLFPKTGPDKMNVAGIAAVKQGGKNGAVKL